MGLSNGKEKIIDNVVNQGKKILNDKPNLKNNILQKEIIKRENQMKNRENKLKFELNIFIYSNSPIDKGLKKSIENYNSDIYKWNIEEKVGFSDANSKYIFDKCKDNFKEKNFKDVIVIPIKSVENFKMTLKEKGKDILDKMNDLNEEEQPFILIIDENENDFIKYEDPITFDEPEKNINTYTTFLDNFIFKTINYKKKEKDIFLKINFEINDENKLNLFVNYIMKKRNDHNDFEIFINDKLFYQRLYIEHHDFTFEKRIKEEFDRHNNIQVRLLLYNINLNEYYDYFEQLGIYKIEILFYSFKKELLNNILNNKKYDYIDKRNFKVIKSKHSPKNYLLKYTGYYNQLGEILFFDQVMFYSAKINIAVGGYIGSGKSTLINTIFEDKICMEGKGSSITNFVYQLSLKEYPITFFDFPGFRAQRNGKKNTSLFVEEIKSKLSDLKKLDEVIHCFLFCIKYEGRIFDEKDEDIQEVFDAISELRIRTFFIITGSEEEHTREFRDFKKILLNNLEKVKKKYAQDIIKKIFGEDPSNSIIPILSRDKIYHGNKVKAFGLDNLFKKLYEYFEDKIINYQKELYYNEETLKIFIKDNELLKIFESKQKLSNDLRDKIKNEFEKFLYNFLLKAPKYIYSFSEESLYEIVNEVIQHFFYIFNCYLNQKNDIEKYQFVNSFFYKELKLKALEEFNHLEKELNIKRVAENIKNKIPFWAKLLFPVLSPFYYIIGTPIFKIFSENITDYFLNEIIKFKMDDVIFNSYFEGLAYQLNRGIISLKLISKHFEDNYDLKKFEEEILKICNDDNIEINYKSKEELRKILNKLKINKVDVLKEFNNIIYENENNLSSICNRDAKIKKLEEFIKNN